MKKHLTKQNYSNRGYAITRTDRYFLFLVCGLLFSVSTFAQLNPLSNPGFESGLSGWNTSNHPGTSSVSTSGARSGDQDYANSTSTTATTGYVESNSSVSVPNNKYLVLIMWFKTNNATNSRVSIGVNGNMGSAVTPGSSNAWIRIMQVVQNTTGAAKSYTARLNMYRSGGSGSRNFDWDDMVAYVSSSSTADITKPSTPTNVSASAAGSGMNLTWTNASDNSGGSGLARTIILRSATGCPSTAPALNDQAVYSAAGGYGVSDASNGSATWTVLDTVPASVASYTDATYTATANYTYAIVHEDVAYNHSAAATVFVPLPVASDPVSPADAQTGVLYGSPNPTLSWNSTCGATYDVYFSSNKTNVDNLVSTTRVATNLTSTTYTVTATLTANTTYYWRVVPKVSSVAVNTTGTWSFTTMPALSYEISRSTGITYNSIASTGSAFDWGGNLSSDDILSQPLDLTSYGFTGFKYQGMDVTTMKVNSNGFVTFNMSSDASYVNNFSGQEMIIAPMWEDLTCQGFSSGLTGAQMAAQLSNSIKWQITGTSGNQVLTIEWMEMETYNNPGPSLNFQLKLYESDDHIEFVYGNMTGFNGTNNYTFAYSSGITGRVVASTPASGQLVCQQIANVRNFSNTNTNSLAIVPACYSMISFVPSASPGAASESAPALTNDNCSGAITLNVSASSPAEYCNVYTTSGATASTSIPACSAGTPGNADDDVWFTFTTTQLSNTAVTVNGSGGFDPVVQLFSGTCGSLTSAGCVNATSTGLTEVLTQNNMAPGTYYVRVYHAGTGSGGSHVFSINVNSVTVAPNNDNCSGATALTIGVSSSSGNTSGATASTGITNCSGGGTPDDDVWYRFTATSTVTRITVTPGSGYNASFQYFSGSCTSLTSVSCVNDYSTGMAESADISTTVGTTYFMRVFHSPAGSTPGTGFSVLVENAVPSCPELTTPADNTTNITSTTSNTFRWNAAASPSVGSFTYTVQIATDPTFTSLVSLTGNTGITATSYAVAANKLSASTTYYWRVLAVNTNGTSSRCSSYVFATSGNAPSCVNGFSPENNATNQAADVTLSWTAGSGTPTGYDVYLGTSASAVSSLSASLRVSGNQAGTSYATSGLSYSTTYYWIVIAKNASGSAASCITNSFTTLPPPPSNDNCSGNVTLTVNAASATSGTTLNSTQSQAGCAGVADDDVWYSFVATGTSHTISVTGQDNFNAVVELFSGSCGSLSSLGCKNETYIGGTEYIMATSLTSGTRYYVRVYDFGTGTSVTTSNFTIRVSNVDIGISALVSPSAASCGNNTVTFEIRNYAVSSLDLAVNPVTVSGQVTAPSGTVTGLTPVVLNSGTLAAGATQQVTLTSTYNVANAGTYTYSGAVSASLDLNTDNNSISQDYSVALPSPYIVSGTGAYCAGGNGIAVTLSGSQSGVNYQLYSSTASVGSSVAGTGSSISFGNQTAADTYTVIATNSSSGCSGYMSGSGTVTVNPLWLGVNTSWTNTSNWCGGVVPTSSTNIVIDGSATNMPVLAANTTINSLSLASGKKIVLNGFTLTVNGTISGDGTIQGGGNSSLVVNGAAATINMNQATPGTTNKLVNLTVNSGTSPATGSVTLANAVVLTGTVTMQNGTLNTGDNLTLVSDASGTARIAAIASTADISGNVIAQRYVPGGSGKRRYRCFSSPVSGFTWAQLKDNIFVTGPGGATNGFDANGNNAASAYTYQESPSGGRGWKASPTINTAVPAGTGLFVFVRGDRTQPSSLSNTAIIPNNVTLDYVGAVNKGNISPSLTYNNTGDASNDGMNLVGNPYPSQINWNLVTKTRLSSFYYIYNPATGSYVADNGTNLIGSGQAFFVQATGASPALTFTESCKASTAPVNYFKTAPMKLTVKMTKDSFNSDIAFMEFSSGAAENYDISEDALKMNNDVINMGFFTSDGQRVQYNTTPVLTHVADTFILFATASAGSYTLDFTGISDCSQGKTVLLHDLFLDSVIDLSATTTYAFSITTSAASKGNRFQLIFADPSALPVKLTGVYAIKAGNNAVVSWTTAEEVNTDRFVIERSFDNKTFEAIGEVKATGYSNTVRDYSFTDVAACLRAEQLNSQVIYYRLHMIDLDGSAGYSGIVPVSVSKLLTTAAVTVYPNPASDAVQLDFGNRLSGRVHLSVYDQVGKLHIEKMLDIDAGSPQAETLDLNGLNAGIYQFVAQEERSGTQLSGKFIKK